MVTDIKKFKEAFGFLLAQEVAKAAPKDTGLLARSFPGTAQVQEGVIKYTVPFYFEFVEFGHVKRDGKLQPPNPFFRDTLHRKGKVIMQQALDIADR